ncbi:hypothetical protein F4820DRAFT_427071 [Hypoxylon rubiginosum]|uniref:Uncharacterized protein n=1 Tax=Hypoxylon rubiginosum TaxID=110542 RepID=A0ACB9YW50_9PEZI|nr:hypothetical protein F4820DRAFT_427071 [Hypoxylon rubiginosum]
MVSFPEDLPPRPESSWRERNCPGFRGCFDFSWEAYSLYTSDPLALARRICMITTLGVRTALSILGFFFGAYGGSIAGLVFSSIFAVIGFFFVAWCLARIGEAQGTRKVFGISMGRWHFDIFLFLSALMHVGFLLGYFTGLGRIGLIVSWYGMWILIAAVAWITTWAPEQPDTYL